MCLRCLWNGLEASIRQRKKPGNSSEGYHKTVGSTYLVGTSSVPYCNSKSPTRLMVVDAKTQHWLIDQPFQVPKHVQLSKMSEKSHETIDEDPSGSLRIGLETN